LTSKSPSTTLSRYFPSAGATALIEAARTRSVPAVDGLELLIAQGALSFRLFTGVQASREAMRAALGPQG